MPGANRIVRDIYMATSMEELNHKVSLAKVPLKMDNLTETTKKTLKIFEGAKQEYERGDEEKGYILFMRFVEVYMKLKESPAYKTDPTYCNLMITSKMVKEALDKSDQLSKNLSQRYEVKKISSDQRQKQIGKEDENDLFKKNEKKSVTDVHDVDRIEASEQITIECTALMEHIEMQKDMAKVLIIDVRSADEFEESHIDKLKSVGDVSVINVSKSILEPGISCNKLENQLPFGAVKDAFQNRYCMKKVIIMDKFSDEYLPETPAQVLFDCLMKWDASAYKVRHKPLLLKGGYEQWLLTYPMYSSNPLVVNRKVEIIRNDFKNLSFNYDIDENEKPIVKTNGFANGEVDSPMDVENSALTNMFLQKPIGAAIPGTARPVIPDRKTKPFESSQKVESTTKNVSVPDRTKKPPVVGSQETKPNVNESDDKIDIEKIRLKKQAEATEEMKNEIENQYEKELTKLNEKKMKDDEEKRLLQEQNIELRMALDKESKRKEEQSKPPHLILPNGDSPNFTNIINTKLHQITNGTIEVKKVNDSDESSQSKVMKMSKSPNTLSVGSPLSRSLSSPNIAQLMAEEEESDKKKLMSNLTPQVNRSLKPNNHTFNLIEMSSDNRVRDFMPVYGIKGQAITGLKNLGNTCFMNAAIQCLINIPEFADFFKEKFKVNRNTKFGSCGELAVELGYLVRTIAYPSQFKSVAPKDFREAVYKYCNFSNGEQQDAHEFLVMIFEKLHADLNLNQSNDEIQPPISEDLSVPVAMNKFWNRHNSKNNSIITKLFEGLILQAVRCLDCGKTSNTFEVFSFLSVPVQVSRCSLSDCFQMLLKTEIMSGESAYECPTCKRKVKAEKKIAICKTPPYLLIHLKRFSFEGLYAGRKNKLGTYVDFPLEHLELQLSNVSCSPNTQNRHHQYNLHGVINHYGTMEGGHYTAYVKHPAKGHWFKYDDNEVSLLSPAEVVTAAAYVLFYVAAT